jgi:hypothetical protein
MMIARTVIKCGVVFFFIWMCSLDCHDYLTKTYLVDTYV